MVPRLSHWRFDRARWNCGVTRACPLSNHWRSLDQREQTAKNGFQFPNGHLPLVAAGALNLADGRVQLKLKHIAVQVLDTATAHSCGHNQLAPGDKFPNDWAVDGDKTTTGSALV